MKKSLAFAVSATVILAFTAPLAQADSISEVEGARIKERQGQYLTRQDREKLRRYGRNADYGYGYYGYGGYYIDGYYGGPGISVYVGPRRYYGYGPYGY